MNSGDKCLLEEVVFAADTSVWDRKYRRHRNNWSSFQVTSGGQRVILGNDTQFREMERLMRIDLDVGKVLHYVRTQQRSLLLPKTGWFNAQVYEE